MTVSDKCSARNRDTCPHHGAIDHARIDVTTAQQKYDEAVIEYDNTDANIRDTVPSRNTNQTKVAPAKNKVNATKHKLSIAQAQLDSFPSELKKLKNEIDEMKTINDRSKMWELWTLEERFEKASTFKEKQAEERKIEKEKLKAEKKARAANAVIFKRISEEVTASKNNVNGGDNWKDGYKKAVTGVMSQQGHIVNGKGTSSYGSYTPAIDVEKTEHFRECGTLDIRNVEEDSWDEWEYSSMSDAQSTRKEFRVTGEATCNCGMLTCEDIEVSGTFGDITRQVLNF